MGAEGGQTGEGGTGTKLSMLRVVPAVSVLVYQTAINNIHKVPSIEGTLGLLATFCLQGSMYR